jgi:hypothetical protein
MINSFKVILHYKVLKLEEMKQNKRLNVTGEWITFQFLSLQVIQGPASMAGLLFLSTGSLVL